MIFACDLGTHPLTPALNSGLAMASVVALAVVAGTSCAPGGGGAGHGFQMPPTPIELADVRLQIMRDEFHALGSIEALDNAQIVSEVSGTVKSLPFIEGQQVKAGALLAQLDDREMRAQADHAEAAAPAGRFELRPHAEARRPEAGRAERNR